MRTEPMTATRLRRTPIYPALTLVRGLPTVNGRSFYSWTEALAAKEAGVVVRTLDIFGCDSDAYQEK